MKNYTIKITEVKEQNSRLVVLFKIFDKEENGIEYKAKVFKNDLWVYEIEYKKGMNVWKLKYDLILELRKGGVI
jgi:hypothetical protein